MISMQASVIIKLVNNNNNFVFVMCRFRHLGLAQQGWVTWRGSTHGKDIFCRVLFRKTHGKVKTHGKTETNARQRKIHGKDIEKRMAKMYARQSDRKTHSKDVRGEVTEKTYGKVCLHGELSGHVDILPHLTGPS